ncbi:putative RNA-directed DNA polymerase [Tanacetum coccineum]
MIWFCIPNLYIMLINKIFLEAGIGDKIYKSKSDPNLASRDDGMLNSTNTMNKDGNKNGSLAMKFRSKSYDGAMDSSRLWKGKLSGSRSSCAKSIRVNRKIGEEELSQLEEFGESIGLIWEGRHKAAGNDAAIPEPREERAGIWIGVDDMVGFVNIYGPHNESDRKALWCRISTVISSVNACWCIFGDFNEVKRLDERINTEFSTRGDLEFNDFIRRANLTDVSLGGKRFTRISDDVIKFSKLDRFLVSEEFQRIWRNIGSVALDRKLSDHCPIVLLDKGLDFGPKPFRFFDAWMEETDFQELVRNAWMSKEKYRGLDAEIESARKEADLWEKEVESRTLVDYELELWQKARANWIEKDGIKAKMLKQKARIQWYEEGNGNSMYFHAKIRKRYRKNGFRGLMVDGMWCENPTTIKQTVYEYFKGVYSELGTGRPKFSSSRFKRLSESEANLLEVEFEEKEEIIKSDILKAVRWFWENERISRGCNQSFVALIPKIVDPISLDRFILDEVLLVNEVVDFIKKSKNSCLIFKVDFEKAYDCVNWEFLYEVMSQMGFGRKWCGWIRACLETATSSILVNGTPTKEFVLQHGIRQGDPLSPFLFLIVAEGLNIMMQEVLNSGLFEVSGLKVNLNKSKLYGIGIEMEEIEDYARSLECRAGKLPFLYLGLPIGNNKGRIENWNIMVDKFKRDEKAILFWDDQGWEVEGCYVTSLLWYLYSFVVLTVSLGNKGLEGGMIGSGNVVARNIQEEGVEGIIQSYLIGYNLFI